MYVLNTSCSAARRWVLRLLTLSTASIIPTPRNTSSRVGVSCIIGHSVQYPCAISVSTLPWWHRIMWVDLLFSNACLSIINIKSYSLSLVARQSWLPRHIVSSSVCLYPKLRALLIFDFLRFSTCQTEHFDLHHLDVHALRVRNRSQHGQAEPLGSCRS